MEYARGWNDQQLPLELGKARAQSLLQYILLLKKNEATVMQLYEINISLCVYSTYL